MLEVLGRAVVPRKTCLTYTLGHIKYATRPSGMEPTKVAEFGVSAILFSLIATVL